MKKTPISVKQFISINKQKDKFYINKWVEKVNEYLKQTAECCVIEDGTKFVMHNIPEEIIDNIAKIFRKEGWDIEIICACNLQFCINKKLKE